MTRTRLYRRASLLLSSLVLTGCLAVVGGERRFEDIDCERGEECPELPGASSECIAGRCSLGVCAPRFADCNGVGADGCETRVDQASDCGGCGVSCAADERCDSAAEPAVCAAGCDGAVCGGVCVDTDTDRQHCGGCDRACGEAHTASAECAQGECAIECLPDHDDCNGVSADGCEQRLDTASDCGGCGASCSAGEVCDATVEPAACAAGCDDTLCGETCVDPTSNRLHCGQCGHECGSANTSSAMCVGGACDLACRAGFEDCNGEDGDGCEADLTSLETCGDCATRCEGGDASYRCEGACVIDACDAGFEDCNGVVGDGCEVDLLTDVGNCGGCGVTCEPATACRAGVCDPVVDVAFGQYHSCVLRQSGAVLCLGQNLRGQLGGGGPRPAFLPQPVLDSSGLPLLASALSSGNESVCAVVSGGLVCWGQSAAGQLGRALPTSTAVGPVESDDPDFAGRTFVDVAGSNATKCALDTLGDVWCWGSNSRGQVGVGSTVNVQRATHIALPAAAAMVDAGVDAGCAVLVDGRLFCWGENAQLQAGQPGGGSVLTPTAVDGVTDAAAVSVGNFHTCLLDVGGEVECFGGNAEGELGLAGGGRPTPMAVTLPMTVESVHAGFGSTCAVGAGRAFCWGRDQEGQLGLGAPSSSVPTPTEVAAFAGASRIYGGWSRRCALVNGVPRCSGNDASGELSQTAGADWLRADRVVEAGAPIGADAIGVGGSHACAVEAGTLRCWGWSTNGQLMVGATTPSRAPAPVVAPSGVTGFAQFAGGRLHSCVLAETPGGTQAYCAGYNGRGSLGRDTGGAASTPALAPVELAGTEDEIDASDDFACARQAGSVYCWGHNSSGQLGRTTSGSFDAAPGLVEGIDDATQLALGATFACAIRASGAVFCWGDDSQSQRGDGDNDDGAVLLPAGSVATEISAGSTHACARLDTGELRCWGDNSRGRIGDGTVSDRPSPVAVVDSLGAPILDALDVAAGFSHTCAIRAGGGVACWGADTHLQRLGAGEATRAVPVPGIVDAVAIETSSQAFHTCVIVEPAAGGREVACFGSRTRGRAGTAIPEPVAATVRPYRNLPGIEEALP